MSSVQWYFKPVRSHEKGLDVWMKSFVKITKFKHLRCFEIPEHCLGWAMLNLAM